MDCDFTWSRFGRRQIFFLVIKQIKTEPSRNEIQKMPVEGAFQGNLSCLGLLEKKRKSRIERERRRKTKPYALCPRCKQNKPTNDQI